MPRINVAFYNLKILAKTHKTFVFEILYSLNDMLCLEKYTIYKFNVGPYHYRRYIHKKYTCLRIL